MPRIDVAAGRQAGHAALGRLGAGAVPGNRGPAAGFAAAGSACTELHAARPRFLTAIVSPGLSSMLGMLQCWPLTMMWPCVTSWRAAARTGAKPRRCTTLSSRRSRMLSSTSPVFSGEREASVEVPAELPLEDAVEALELLLLAQADAVLARLAAAVPCMPGGALRRSMAHLGLSQRVPLRYSFMPSRRQSRQTGSSMASHSSRLVTVRVVG